MASAPPGDGDLAAGGEELEHLGDVAVVRPARRGPRHRGGVRDVAGRQWTRRGELFEDPLAERIVGGEPFGGTAPPVGRPIRHLGEVQTEVGHRAHHDEDRLDGRVLATVLEQRAVLLERLLQLSRVVGVAEAAPRDQIGTWRHHGRRVELQEGQVLDDREQIVRPLARRAAAP